jgi:hypothetical protein
MSELSGSNGNYYILRISHPLRALEPYTAECTDIIEALDMTFSEGEAFKALWRRAAARLGNGKPGNSGIYDAEKMHFYTGLILSREKRG